MAEKILFTDLDGTLLNDEKQISGKNRKAIEQAVAMGHRVVLSSGRATQSVYKQVRKLGLDRPGCYAIAFNGAAVLRCDTGEALYEKGLDFEVAEYLFREAKKAGIHCQTYQAGYTLAERHSEILEFYDRSTQGKSKIVPDIRKALTTHPPKVLLAELTHSGKLEAFKEAHEAALAGKAEATFSCREYLEYLLPGVNKGYALGWLCDYLNVPRADSVAAGDEVNDLSMIRAAGVGAAMVNGVEALRAEADYITQADNNHDGLAEIIYRFILEES
ncbi:MAG TPA: Cof-type HAD-IIB family hydrolase [Lachnospiraceae bacterium]|nr:Cof-type HAD-IIB family hydrolase [Lachnospiraceae bacterium]